ncbi:hypothetical protein OAB51_01300 [Gammaproteobacteria bacterium]|nr:hypothetical protein [Gammaproteobacteria bacterium]MDB9815991.1 hypothetical protein [Gammaproteobacteria bacterium]
MNNQSSLIKKLSNIEKDNLPRVTFFFRHINDLDFSLPLVLFGVNARIIFYQTISSKDRRIQLLKDHDIPINNLNNSALDILEVCFDLFLAFLHKVFLNKVANFLKLKFEIFICFFLKKAMKDLIKTKNIFQDVNIYSFDHTSCMKSKTLIEMLRNECPKNSKINIISLPHGADIFKNRMLSFEEIDLASNIQDYNHFDHVICNDQRHFDMLDGKKTILDSLRYTPEWQHYIGSYGAKLPKGLNNISEASLLFLLSKFEGGINIKEVQRAINIIQKFSNIKLKIKAHPRGLRELNKLNIYNAELVSGDVQEHIALVDCVINIQSNAVFDAYIQNKPVIYPAYMTSNDWVEDVKKHALVVNTPDDFFKCIQNISNNEFPKTSDYHFISWGKAMQKWTTFFSSLT